MAQQHPSESKYVIATQGDTFTVVFQTRANMSNHESVAEARAAIERYEEADKQRKEQRPGGAYDFPA